MNKTTKLLLGGVIVIIAIIGVVFLTSQKPVKQTSEVTTVRIANLPIVQGLPLYLALGRGYFKAAGLNVKMIKFQSPNQIVDALLSGQVDFVSPSGAMGILGIANLKNPGKLEIYAAAGGNDVIQNDAILVKNGSNISNLQELKGKKLGILPGIQWRTIAQDILAKNNLVAGKDVALVELAPGLQAPALASGEIDALLGVEPIPTIIKVKGIGKEIVSKVTAKYVANPFYGGGGAVRTEFAKQNPKTTKKVLAILALAISEINKNPNAARQYLKGNTPLDNSAIAKVPISIIKMYNNFTSQDINAIQKFYDIFSTYHVVNGKMNFKKLIYSPNN